MLHVLDHEEVAVQEISLRVFTPARFVRPGSDNALHTERAFDSPTAHKRSAELGSDRPGSSFHSRATAHHAVAPRRDPPELEKEKFADTVGGEINQAAADWVLRNDDLTEPWVFLIGADGKILDRWGSLWDPEEVGSELAALPPMS